MKLRLIAASAALLASGTLHAQSSVTLYGVADVGIEASTVRRRACSRRRRPHRAHVVGQPVRLALGPARRRGPGPGPEGGLHAGERLPPRYRQHQRWLAPVRPPGPVGLQGEFGSLTLGRQQTPVYDFGITYDPMALSARYSMLSQDRGMAGRANNAIKYTGSFGGLTASALYSFGYGDEGERGRLAPGREYAFGLGYADGPFSVGAIYDQRLPSTDKSLGRDVRYSAPQSPAATPSARSRLSQATAGPCCRPGHPLARQLVVGGPGTCKPRRRCR